MLTSKAIFFGFCQEILVKVDFFLVGDDQIQTTDFW